MTSYIYIYMDARGLSDTAKTSAENTAQTEMVNEYRFIPAAYGRIIKRQDGICIA